MKTRRIHGIGLAAAGVLLGLWALHGCGSGPASLETMTSPTDAQRYQEQLKQHANKPGDAWLAWRSEATGRSVDELRRADAALSRTENPYSPKDLETVRLGALVYQTSCVECHGRGANGLDDAGQPLMGTKDFTHSHMRMALKMKPDRLAKWFVKVEQGSTSEKPGPDGEAAVMPAFGEILTREQVWLALNYLASDRSLEAEVSH